MPELPEVETIKNYLHKNCLNLKVLKVSKFRENLRWAMPDVSSLISGQKIQDITRRAKYLIIKFDTGNLIMHFGMSGFLTIINEPYDTWLKSKKHDHFAIAFENKVLVLNDARRFGAVLWHDAHNINNHELLKHLGPEPLSESFSPEYLHEILKGRKLRLNLPL